MMFLASNLEKYLVRYAGLIIMFFIYAVALLASDLVQYLLNIMIGKYDTVFVLSYLADRMQQASIPYFSTRELVAVAVTLVWLNSLYALGGTFFRSHKYAWVFVTLIIILAAMLMAWMLPKDNVMALDADNPLHVIIIGDAIYVAWAMLNYWLAYRCFCRSQVIGKFINW